MKKYSQGKGMESVFHHPMKIIHFFFIGKITKQRNTVQYLVLLSWVLSPTKHDPTVLSIALAVLLLRCVAENFMILLFQVCTGAKSEQQSKLAARKVENYILLFVWVNLGVKPYAHIKQNHVLYFALIGSRTYCHNCCFVIVQSI